MSYSTTILADSPIRYYKLNESSGTTATDSGSQAANGTYEGSYTQAQTSLLASDSGNTCTRFNSSPSLSDIFMSASSMPAGSSSWSQEAWFKCSTLPGNAVAYAICGWGTDTALERAYLLVEGTAGNSHIVLTTLDAGTAITTSNSIVVSTSYHIAATYNGSTTTVYINGVSAGTGSGTLALVSTYAGIARETTDNLHANNTFIQHVAFYSTCLTSTQVLAHYKAGATTRYVPCTVALLATKTRTVTAKTPLLLTKTRTVTSTVALSIVTTGYAWKKSLTIDHTKVSGSANLTNFPVLISHTDTSLKVTGSGGHVTSSSGFDIIFTNSAGTLKYNHELVSYTSTTGQIIAWVQVPSVSFTADTVFAVFYGNSGITTTQEAITATWDSNYLGVYHLDNNPAGTAPQMIDSTTHQSGTSVNMVSGDSVTGQIFKGTNFNGTTKSINVGTTNSVKGASQVTLSAWLNITALNTAAKHDLYSEAQNSGNTRLNLIVNQSNKIELNGRSTDAGALTTWATSTATVAATTWYYCVGIYDSVANTHHLILNGTDTSASVTVATFPSTTPSVNTAIGAHSGTASEWVNGIIEELRLSNTVRTVGWSITEYNNQLTPSTFYSQGTEAAAGVTTSTRTIPCTAVLLATRTRTVTSATPLLATKTRTVSSTTVLFLTKTRTTSATTPLLQVRTRTISATTPLLAAKTRSIGCSAALLATKTRTITTTVTLSIKRTVPVTVALLQTKTRTIASSAVLLSTKARSITSTTPLVLTRSRSLPCTVALLATKTRTIGTSCPLLQASKRTVNASAVLILTKQRTITSTGVLLSTKIRAVSTSTPLLATKTRSIASTVVLSIKRTIPCTIALLSTKTRAIPVSGVLLAIKTRVVSSATPLLSTRTRTVGASCVLIATRSRSLTCTIALTTPGAHQRNIPVSCVLIATQHRTVGSTGVLFITKGRTVTASTPLSLAKTRTVTTTSALSQTRTRVLSASIALLATKSRAIPTRAVLLSTGKRVLTATAPLLVTHTRVISTSIALIGTRTRGVVTHTPLQVTQVRSISVHVALLVMKSRVIGVHATLIVANAHRLIITTITLIATEQRSVLCTACLSTLTISNTTISVRSGQATCLVRSGQLTCYVRSGQATINVRG